MLEMGTAKACHVVGHTSDGEPLCMTTSDASGFNRGPSDDDSGRSSRGMWWRHMQQAHRAAMAEGRNHTSDMATGGTKISGTNITVSPYVPGSVQDKGWQSERKRRGLCGNDRLCLSAQ